MYGSLVCATYVDETLNLDELDTEEEDETHDEENEGRNDHNEGCGVSNFGDAEELGGTEFGSSWEPWR